MRKQIILLLLLLCGTLAQAQSIEQHIRQQREGVGQVNLHISESVYHAMITENSALEEEKTEKTLDEQLKELENFKKSPKSKEMQEVIPVRVDWPLKRPMTRLSVCSLNILFILILSLLVGFAR